MNATMWTMALLVGAAAIQVQAQSTWALQFDIQGTQGGQKLELVAAEHGDYAVSPTRVDGDFTIVARDAAGRMVYARSVADPRRLQAEAFDPLTGRIVQSRAVLRPQGQFELRVPAHEDVASIAIEMRQPGLQTTTLRQYRREEIERSIVHTLQRPQSNRNVSGTAMLHQSGPPSRRFDIILIGDGYTAAEQAKWQADAQRVADGVLADSLFDATRSAVNIRRVDVVSAESGIDDLVEGTYRDTALGMNMGCYNIDRLVCADDELVFKAVGAVTPADGRDLIVAIANTTRYGGAGGAIATMTMHTSAIELALHEIGHTSFGLADEYDYGTCEPGEPAEPNTTRQTALDTIKWGDLIQSSMPMPTPTGAYANGTIGLFTGARYCKSDVYRPTEDSRMRTLGRPWHLVNERHANAVIASYYQPGDSTTVRSTLAGPGAIAYHPARYHYSTAGGVASAYLSGPSNANFELALLRWNGRAWITVASSTSPTSTESIHHTASRGYYVLQVKSLSGSGPYELNYELPR
ncbi:M64 family metallopeptidase [Chitinimonas lacunae]|uniref:M64 family metallopeptidase n=1 Tax=Chitinimonas lacunae TaxID=1963018 RepID=A0ABV8MRB5_9NEIS